MRNLLATVPKGQGEMVAALVRTIFAQADAEATRDQLRQVVTTLEGRFAKAAALLAEAEHDVTAYAVFPRAHWRKIWSTNPLSVIRPERPTAGGGCVAGGRLGWTLERAGEGRADDGAGSGRYRGHLAA